MRQLVLFVFIVFSLVYPATLFWGDGVLAPHHIAALLAIISIGRFWFERDTQKSASSWFTLVASIGLCAAIGFMDQPWVPRLYPALISCLIAFSFWVSLDKEQSLIEVVSRKAGKHITPNAKRYTRKLTALWALLLLINAVMAAGLAVFAPIGVWALYTGGVSYGILGLFMAGEFVYRQYYIRKYGA